ncbi:MAG: thioredoxin [Bacteroidales bacterium]|nr:thioredoxin [Bacteroidales bacterium]
MKKLVIFSLVAVLGQSVFSQRLLSENKSQAEGNNIEYLTAATFKQKVFDYTKSKTWNYKGKLPCIIDFYADWCRPCKMIAPYLEELSQTYKGKIYVYKVNTDKEQELAQIFGIQSIPAVLFVPMTGEPQMMIGAHPKTEYEKQVNTFLKVKK